MPHHPSSRAVLGGLLLLGACARPADSTRAPTPEPAPPSATAPEPAVPVASNTEPESPEASSSSPYADLPAPPTRAAPPGPYGDPKGWEDRRRAPDPWATDVMKALNAIEFPEHGSETADVQFELSLCKDGSVKPTVVGGASGPDLKAALMARIRATSVPVPPPHVRATMTSDCARLRTVFRWRGDAIR